MIGLPQKTVNNSLQQQHSGLKPQKIGPDILWKRQQNCHFLLNQNRLILAFVLSPKKNLTNSPYEKLGLDRIWAL